MKNILLINPNYRLEIRWVASEDEIGVRADYFPLGLATVAALTPPLFHVDIWDELVRGPIEEGSLDKAYDLVGVTSHSANLARALEIGSYFRKKGTLVAVGGPGVTSNPDRCRGRFDILFISEAELTWPRFLREWQDLSFQPEYRQIEKPDLSLSPMPTWDSIVPYLRRYAMGAVQTTRGCPIDCEFCDVIHLNGRRQRHKPIEQILKEVSNLQRLGVSNVSFNDDNFTIDHAWAKEVLRSLISLNNAFDKPLRFMTQLGIDISRDDELLGLLADANFYEVLVGIETPNKRSLEEAGKYNNLKGDLVAEVHKVLSYGIAVRGAMIVGFDHDDTGIFDSQYRFIQESYLPSISLHMLNAPVGTRLWRRLRLEGRVIDAFAIADSSTQRLFNNTVPKLMSRVELMRGFRDLYARVFTWESFKERMFGYVSMARRAARVAQKKEPMDDLLGLGESLHLPGEDCDAMNDIFRHTERNAPHLLGRVKELVIQFIRYRESVRDFIPGLDRQIELESSDRIKIQMDSRPVPMPAGFRKEFNALFPDIHCRVFRGLRDKTKIPDALVDIFVDFLVHEGAFDRLLEHHGPLLNEISDRTCARLNKDAPLGSSPGQRDYTPVCGDNLIRLKDDILTGVENELMKMKVVR